MKRPIPPPAPTPRWFINPDHGRVIRLSDRPPPSARPAPNDVQLTKPPKPARPPRPRDTNTGDLFGG